MKINKSIYKDYHGVTPEGISRWTFEIVASNGTKRVVRQFGTFSKVASFFNRMATKENAKSITVLPMKEDES